MRSVSGVVQVIEVGQVFGLDGHGEGVVVQQTHAGDIGHFAIVVFLATNDEGVGSGLAAQISQNLGAGPHSIPNKVLGGDGLAVVVHQTLVDGHGEGLGAVGVLLSGQLLGDGGVDHQRATLIGHDRSAVVRQITDHLVGSIVGPVGSVPEVAANLGAGTVDDGALLGRSFRSFRNSSSHGEHHAHSQQKSKKLLHVEFSSLFLF